jgi:hypothetical protein
MVLYDLLGITGIIIFVVSSGLLFEVAARVFGRLRKIERKVPAALAHRSQAADRIRHFGPTLAPMPNKGSGRAR